jgi:hypothetical protein
MGMNTRRTNIVEYAKKAIQRIISSSIDDEAEEAVALLKSELGKLLPKYYSINVNYRKMINGMGIAALIFDARRESVKVTWHNSPTVVHLLMYISEGRGGPDYVPVRKLEWDKVVTYLPEGVKYRKISSTKSSMDAAKKLVMWFKKNQKAFAETPE